MILSTKTILELNRKYNLIENLSEREQTNPEGVGIDVRVGEIFRLKGRGYLGVIERKTPNTTKIADIKKGDKTVILKPGDYVLVKTIERVNLPASKVAIQKGMKALLMLDAHPRSTLQRSGIYFMGTKTDPGYSGELTFALANLSSNPFKLELGARIANLTFEQVIGDIFRSYGGQWRGGRVATRRKEKQN